MVCHLKEMMSARFQNSQEPTRNMSVSAVLSLGSAKQKPVSEWKRKCSLHLVAIPGYTPHVNNKTVISWSYYFNLPLSFTTQNTKGVEKKSYMTIG